MHRRTIKYLITLNEQETHSVANKIARGVMMGIDEVIVAQADAFDILLSTLACRQYLLSQPVEVISKGRLVQPNAG
ncbi:MAG: hypothetical protein ROO73_05925 [Roseivirga sp.]